MLDRLLELIDRLIQLKSVRLERQRRVFAELYQPIFNELIAVHADYAKMFGRAYEAIVKRTGTEGVEMAVEIIQEARREQEALRTKIRAVSEAVPRDKLSKDEVAFWDAVQWYFDDISHQPVGASSAGTEVLEALTSFLQAAKWDTPEDTRKFAAWTVSGALATLRIRWAHACEKFASLQVSTVLK